METRKIHVINLMNGNNWEGKATNAKEAYTHITIKKGDTTVLTFIGLNSKFNQIFTKEW